MTAIVFYAVLIALGWLLGWIQGHESGVLEGKALRQLQDAFERPMLRRKP